MPKRALTSSGVMAILLLGTPSARAHVIHIDWKTTDGKLIVVAYFSNDLPADDADVTLQAADGSVVATGKTDDTGTWKVTKPASGRYGLTVKAFEDHTKTV